MRNPTNQLRSTCFMAGGTSFVAHILILAAFVLLTRPASVQLATDQQAIEIKYETSSAAVDTPIGATGVQSVQADTPNETNPSLPQASLAEPTLALEKASEPSEPPQELQAEPTPAIDASAADTKPLEPQPLEMPQSANAAAASPPKPARPRPSHRPARSAPPKPLAAELPSSSASPAMAVVGQREAQPAMPAKIDGTWMQAVGAWLAAHKTYPDIARRRGEEGRLTVRFTVEPSGQVSAVDLVRSSGSPALDEASRDLLRKAVLPPPPADMTQGSVTVTVQMRYALTP